MANPRRKGNSKSIIEILRFLVCCVTIREPKDESSRVKQHEKEGNISENATASFHDVFQVPCYSDDVLKHQQEYPEYLNPFANDTDDNVTSGSLEMRCHIKTSDYPKHLNPFSDGDDVDDDDDE